MHPRDSRLILRDPDVYLAALGVLRERHAAHGGLRQADLELAELAESADATLAKKLARRVASGEYVFSPVTERRAFLGGKWRQVYRAVLSDTVVLFVLAGVLTGAVAPSLSERLYSYRKGRSSRQAVRDLARFVRAHRARLADVRARGLHVLRRDVSGYGDSIPVHERSPLWPALGAALERAGYGAADPLLPLLERALRPVVVRLDGRVELASRGVPMGSPLQPSVCNLYLAPLDRELEALTGGFSARFGDDITFAHPSAAVTRHASELVDRTLGELELTLNPNKALDRFWNGAGRAPLESVSSAELGTTHVEYLGLRVAFDGGVAPSQRKLRRLRGELRTRITHSERLLRDAPLDDRARALARAVELALDPKSEVSLADARELFTDCDDRRLLGELDRWLWRVLAQALSGRRGVRASRSAPPRWLRERGAVSLVARRARAHREPPEES